MLATLGAHFLCINLTSDLSVEREKERISNIFTPEI